MTLERFTAGEVKQNSYARILLLGAPKAGKTVACCTSSPRPIDVINCDGHYALASTIPFVADDAFTSVTVRCNADWQAACREEYDRAVRGEVRTIVVDTLTMLADTILDEARYVRAGKATRGGTGAVGMDAAAAKMDVDGWQLYADAVMGSEGRSGLRLLLGAPAHLIITAHMAPIGDYVSGVLPAVPGKVIPNQLPRLIDDWILFECDVSGNRRFVLGPQDNWNHSGRNIRKVEKIDADVGLLLEKLGISP